MKSQELKAGVEYAVIPAWDYSSKEKKNPDTVERRYVAKAELVSLDKYEYKVFRSDTATSSNFVPAPKGARSVGYLVKSADFADTSRGINEIYWLARPQDIVAEYATLEPKWAQRELQEKIEQEKREAERLEYERKQKEAQDYVNRVSESMRDSLKSIIGDRINAVRIDTHNRRDANGNYLPTAEITLDLKTMGFLIEKVLEAKDLVG
jgi:hypothetical protein